MGYSRLSLALPLYWVAHEYGLHDWWASELECQCCCRCNLVHRAIRMYDAWPGYRDGSLHRHAVLATDRIPRLFSQVMHMLFLWPQPSDVEAAVP